MARLVLHVRKDSFKVIPTQLVLGILTKPVYRRLMLLNIQQQQKKTKPNTSLSHLGS